MIHKVIFYSVLIVSLCLANGMLAQNDNPVINETYLDSLKSELRVKWPKNRTINLVFHGHSVPAGYFKTPVVNTFESYPFLTAQLIKEQYPYALVNSIVTAIGGENAEQGAARFQSDALNHNPDIIFIDYALNDRRIGLERARISWMKMIELAREQNVKVVLLTPSPDLSEDISDDATLLAQHSEQIRSVAELFGIPVVDSYRLFRDIAKQESLETYMAQGNHINAKGHLFVAQKIYELFVEKH